LDFIKDYFLEANPNPQRMGCPSEEILKAIAEGRLPANHTSRLHLTTCSECFAEFRGYRADLEESWRSHRKVVGWVIAASLILASGGGLWKYERVRVEHRAAVQTAAMVVPVEALVDLFNVGTYRGLDDGTNELQQVLLPAAVVHLSVILPRFSQAGRYEILVSKDKAGSLVVAKGAGDAIGIDGKVIIKVTLDLRAAKAGAYFLATVRGADNGMYYYPLKIK
jgi:hypothetical protein